MRIFFSRTQPSLWTSEWMNEGLCVCVSACSFQYLYFLIIILLLFTAGDGEYTRMFHVATSSVCTSHLSKAHSGRAATTRTTTEKYFFMAHYTGFCPSLTLWLPPQLRRRNFIHRNSVLFSFFFFLFLFFFSGVCFREIMFHVCSLMPYTHIMMMKMIALLYCTAWLIY